MQKKAKANIQRALSVLGAICRHLNFSDTDVTMEDHDEEGETPPLTYTNLTSVLEEIFKVYLNKDDTQTKCAALRGLSGVFIARPREMLRMDQAGLVSEVMDAEAPSKLQLESLLCWRDILLVRNHLFIRWVSSIV